MDQSCSTFAVRHDFRVMAAAAGHEAERVPGPHRRARGLNGANFAGDAFGNWRSCSVTGLMRLVLRGLEEKKACKTRCLACEVYG